MSEKINNNDDWIDYFGGASGSGDGNAPAPQSDDDDWGISNSPSVDATTDDFMITPGSDSDADQLAKEGWICGKNVCQSLVVGDTVRFNETSFDRNNHWHKKSNGCRLNIAKIVSINYDKKGEVKVHFELLESTGDAPLSAGKKYYRYHRNIVRWKCYRKRWDDESLRQELVDADRQRYEEMLANIREQDGAQMCNILSKRNDDNKHVTAIDGDEKQRKQNVERLTDEEQIWVTDGWLKDIDKKRLDSHKPKKGWKQMSDTEDRIVEGDIIWFFDPHYTARYPHGKYCGRSIIVAKVEKVARKYHHLQLIASTGAPPYINKRKQTFRKKLSTVEYWSFYRLWWNSEYARKDKLSKQIKRQFSSLPEYEEYIQPSQQVESPAEDKKQEPLNNQKTNNLLQEKDFMQNRIDAKQWLKEQEKIKSDVFVRDGNYYKWLGRRVQTLAQLSNFVLKAEAKIVQGNQWWFECSAINNSGIIQEQIIIARDDFQSPSALKRVIANDSRFEYYGDSKDTTRIQGLLTNQKPPLKAGTDKLGVHRINDKWIYVEGSRIVGSDGLVNDVVFTKSNLKEDDAPTLLQQPDITQDELVAIAENINRFNEPTIVYPLLGWIGFCLIKERLAKKVNGRNPILLCQGEPGVGKTETISRIVHRIFCSQRPISNIGDMTRFTLAVNGNSSNLVPCFYDEWKESVMTKAMKKTLNSVLLATYNQTNLPRGTTDQTVNDYRFTSPSVILGEMTIESPSLKHRMLELFFTYKGRSGRETYFRNLCQLPLGSFGKGLLLHSLSISDEWLNAAFDELYKNVDSSLDDRFAENAALARVGLWLIIDYLNDNGIAADDYAEGYGCIDNVIKESVAAARITNVDKIISDMSVMSHTRNCSGNWLNVGNHYEIRDGNIYIKIAEAYEAYRRYARTNDVSAEMVNKSSFLQQLQGKPYYEGKKTHRIGGMPCNAVCINLSAIPTYVDVNFAA